MQATKDTVVTLDYRLTLPDGEVIEISDPGDPLVYLHGYEEIVPGLERALEGKAKGDRVQAVVPPEDGYGEYDPEGQETVDRSEFPAELDLEVGGIITATDEDDDEVEFLVKAIDGDKVTVDFNHPMAGKTLHFDVTIRDIRAATAEELEHGHVHGPGGAHD